MQKVAAFKYLTIRTRLKFSYHLTKAVRFVPFPIPPLQAHAVSVVMHKRLSVLILGNVRPQGNITKDHLKVASSFLQNYTWNYGRFKEHLQQQFILSDEDVNSCWLTILQFLATDWKPQTLEERGWRDRACRIIIVSACTYSASSTSSTPLELPVCILFAIAIAPKGLMWYFEFL